MKLTVCLSALLVNILRTLAYDSDVLQYPLNLFEHLVDTRIGTLECVFWDMAPHNPFMSDLLLSPKVKDVPKYVVTGSYRSDILLRRPLFLVIHPGNIDDLEPHIKSKNLFKLLDTIDPATKVFVLWNINDRNVFAQLRWILAEWKFNNVLFFDTSSATSVLSSLQRYTVITDVIPYSNYTFKWFKDQLRGSTIYYERGKTAIHHPNYKWILTIADYLNGTARKFNKTKDDSMVADIQVESKVLYSFSNVKYQVFLVTFPSVGRVLVPRGRPLNVVEMMVMPFEWPVWTLLSIILISAEVIKRFMPDIFRNDPIMMVFSGVKRYNLHDTGRVEKTILQSLIILMFFITNAFETKIISLMIGKPSAPSAQKLEDFDKYGLKFRHDLDNDPGAVNKSIFGKYLVNGPKIEMWETVPGYAKQVTQDMADMVSKVSYDFDRDQTWFVLLDETFLESIEVHLVANRCPYMEAFRYTHDVLDESGIMRLWWREASDFYWLNMCGLRRTRGKDNEENLLAFGDLWLAWIILAVGCCASLIGFIAEILRQKLSVRKAKIENC